MKSCFYKIVIALGFVSLLPFLLICRYVHPVNDDYVYALRESGMNIFQSGVSTYIDWSGRYFATFLSHANPLIQGRSVDTLQPLYSVALILLFVAAVCFFIHSLFRQRLSSLQQISLSALFVVLFLIQAPRISEFFYWFSSYIAYAVPCVLTLLLFALLQRKDTLSVVVQSLLVISIVGSNEVIAVLLAGALFYWASEVYRHRRAQSVILVTVAVLSLLLVIASPGNFHRMSGQLSSHPYVWSFVVSLSQSVSWLFIWLPALLLATAFYIPLFGTKIAQMAVFDRSPKKYLLFVSATIFLAHIPPTLGLSSVMIGRTADDLYLFFIFFYFFGIHILLHRYAETVSSWYQHKLSRLFASCMFFAFTFLCVFQIDTPVATAYIDMMSGKAADYHHVMEQRRVLISRSRGCHPEREAVLCLPSAALVPKTIYVNDLTPDPTDVFNHAYRQYYKLDCGVIVHSPQYPYLSNYESLFLMGKRMRH